MTNLMIDVVASYLQDLTATHEICNALGTVLVEDNNLFVGFRPDTNTDSITLIPYSGSPPEIDGYRQNPSIQVMIKSTNRATALKTGQAFINKLHENTLNGKGKMFAIDSSPMIFGNLEGEEWVISIVNFNLKHVKI